MKKNNISIDFVAFGHLESETLKKLEVFSENVKGGDGSYLAVMQPGANLLSDFLRDTPILRGEGDVPSGGENGEFGSGAGGGDSFEFGVDPSMDPELALALRMSMEEEKARQDKEGKAQGDGAKETPLEGIPEEGGETQPLLNQEGEASGSGGTTEQKDEKPEKDVKDEDKMDTA